MRIIFMVVALLFTTEAGAQKTNKGWAVGTVARVIDGDTFVLHSTSGQIIKIRLWGIDAPELEEREGKKSREMLKAALDGVEKPIGCEPRGRSYERLVARCTGFRGTVPVDIGELMVIVGAARDWPKYSKGKYRAAQKDAIDKGRGMWAGK